MTAVTMLAALVVLPAAVGTALVCCAVGRPRGAAAWAGVVGSGWVLGMLLAAWSTHLTRSAPTQVFGATLGWLLALGALALAFAWWRAQRGGNAAGPDAVPSGPATAVPGAAAPEAPARPAPEGAGRTPAYVAPSAPGRAPHSSPLAGLWWLMLALLLVHVALAAWQTALLPTVPWDAWTTWVGRAKAWWGSDALLSFVSSDAWLHAPEGAQRATLAPHYPETISRLVLWIASAAGGWQPGWIHLPWPLLGGALAAALYGHLRRGGMPATLAMAAAFACVSLPLVNAHMTLAGYADLWVAAVLALAVLHLRQGVVARAPAEVVLGAVWLFALPAIKLEGGVWLGCALAALAWAALPGRWRLWLPVGLALLLALVLPFASIPVPLPGLGVVRLSWGEVEIPAMGTLSLHWRPVLPQVAASLFALGNWHLLWFLLPAIVWLRREALGSQPALRALGAFVLLGHGFLFVLFFFTDAAAWAENLTSVNRLLLHLAPATIAWLAWLCVPRPAPAPPSP